MGGGDGTVLKRREIEKGKHKTTRNLWYVFPVDACYTELLIRESLSFQFFHADERHKSICFKGFWIRADFLSKGRWQEGHPISKVSLVNFALLAQSLCLTLYKGIIKEVKRAQRYMLTHTLFIAMFAERLQINVKTFWS